MVKRDSDSAGGEEIREQEVVTAKSVFCTPAGKMVVDFGQEITGYVEFTVDAHAGDRIHIFMEKFWMQKEISTMQITEVQKRR